MDPHSWRTRPSASRTRPPLAQRLGDGLLTVYRPLPLRWGGAEGATRD